MTSPPVSDPPPPRQARLAEVVSAVLWSFFGIRRGDKMREDAISIRPYQVIIVGVAIAALFVLLLLLIVSIVIRAAGP